MWKFSRIEASDHSAPTKLHSGTMPIFNGSTFMWIDPVLSEKKREKNWTIYWTVFCIRTTASQKLPDKLLKKGLKKLKIIEYKH